MQPHLDLFDHHALGKVHHRNRAGRSDSGAGIDHCISAGALGGKVVAGGRMPSTPVAHEGAPAHEHHAIGCNSDWNLRLELLRGKVHDPERVVAAQRHVEMLGCNIDGNTARDRRVFNSTLAGERDGVAPRKSTVRLTAGAVQTVKGIC